MNDVPHNDDTSDDIDDLYRRAAAQDPSRPSDAVRQAVLTHAAQRAADRSFEREPAKDVVTPDRPMPIDRHLRRRPRYLRAIGGTLAAAVLVGLLVLPRFLLAPDTPPPPRASEIRPYAAAPQARQNAQTNLSASNAEGVTSNAIAPPSYAPPVTAAPAPLTPAPALIGGRAAPTATTAEVRHAAELDDIPALQTLFDQGVDINARDANGRTPLMLAVLNGQSKAVEVLLAHGADATAADWSGTTPLQAAQSAHRSAIAAALRRAGAH
jgi:hypothetical protein